MGSPIIDLWEKKKIHSTHSTVKLASGKIIIKPDIAVRENCSKQTKVFKESVTVPDSNRLYGVGTKKRKA